LACETAFFARIRCESGFGAFDQLGYLLYTPGQNDFRLYIEEVFRMDWLLNIVVWIIVGALAGWLASMVMGTNRQQGLLADIIIGIVGAFIGGFVLNLIPGVTPVTGGLSIGSILTAVVGAIILLAVLRLLRRT
jgi:uncharacterized membrane protein YeaQ/YmgE (transglycosylase-associated protein family)